ncbi:MAG: hypothetical protein ACIAQF_03530 [Phycisphaerales bacterium JB065]
MLHPIFLLLTAGSASSDSSTADPDSLNRLRVLLWIGLAALILLFGIVLLVTMLRVIRRRYFTQQESRAAAEASPWQAAGQRVHPVAGGELLEGETPDDDPERYERERQARMDRDLNEDTGPLPDSDEDEGWREDDDDEDRW